MSKMNHSTQWSSSDVGGLCWVSDPAQAYIEARVTSVEKGVVRAYFSAGDAASGGEIEKQARDILGGTFGGNIVE